MLSARQRVGVPAALAYARSWLFVPANDVRKVVRALASGADAVILDLEDAIPPQEKPAARACLAAALEGRSESPLVFIRVNGTGTEWFSADLAAADMCGADGVVLPKADDEALVLLDREGLPVVAIVESARGLRSVDAVAGHPRVHALLLGGADLGAELALEYRPDGLELLFARSQLVVAAAAAGLRPPIDVVHLDVRAEASLRAESALARTLGMSAKACIHPNQITIVNDVFSPTERDVASARAVIAAYEAAVAEGAGVAVVDGKMIDLPLVSKAERILSLATALGASTHSTDRESRFAAEGAEPVDGTH